jgi:hypothetical protein
VQGFKKKRMKKMADLDIRKRLRILTVAIGVFAQDKSWTKDEQQYYTTMKSLCEHFKGKTYDTTQRDIIFERFVYFDYILADTSKSTVQKRIRKFDALFYRMTHFIDSVGLDNLEARPTRYFKDQKGFSELYKSGEMNDVLPFTLTYFDKRRPEEQPLGALLFDAATHKLLSWMLIGQGGSLYFLTFNML